MIIKIKDILFRIVYILIIVYLLTFVPAIWKHKPLVVISGSMEPTLNVGGILYYHEQDIDTFKKGDVLVYKTKHHIISHRIFDKTDTGFITKGDANRSIDSSEINYSQVLGKGTNWCIPLLGYYSDFIYHHKYLLVISIFILAVDLCFDLYRSRKKKVGVNDEKSN